LEDLGEWIGEMHQLSKLDLSCNQLKRLPDTILLPRNLSFLNLRKNLLKNLPDSIFDERIGAQVRLPSPLNLVTVDVRENEFESLPVNLIGPALVELKSSQNPWQPRCESFHVDSYQAPTPSLLDLVCSRVLQNDQNHSLLAHVPRPVQLHVLRNSKRCQHCERPLTHQGIDCFVWRATTDTPEVPFKANVCSRPCLRSLDGYPIK
jgi:Leucine-rich repeat (LRR) protein